MSISTTAYRVVIARQAGFGNVQLHFSKRPTKEQIKRAIVQYYFDGNISSESEVKVNGELQQKVDADAYNLSSVEILDPEAFNS